MDLNGYFGSVCAICIRNGNGYNFRFLDNRTPWLDPVDVLNVVSSLPQVAEFVDERPEEVKQMETFRSSAKWKLLGGEFQQ